MFDHFAPQDTTIFTLLRYFPLQDVTTYCTFTMTIPLTRRSNDVTPNHSRQYHSLSTTESLAHAHYAACASASQRTVNPSLLIMPACPPYSLPSIQLLEQVTSTLRWQRCSPSYVPSSLRGMTTTSLSTSFTLPPNAEFVHLPHRPPTCTRRRLASAELQMHRRTRIAARTLDTPRANIKVCVHTILIRHNGILTVLQTTPPPTAKTSRTTSPFAMSVSSTPSSLSLSFSSSTRSSSWSRRLAH